MLHALLNRMDNLDQIIGDERFNVEDFINELTWRWTGDQQANNNASSTSNLTLPDSATAARTDNKPHHQRWLNFNADVFLQRFDELTRQLQSCYTNQQIRATRIQSEHDELNKRGQKVLQQLVDDLDNKHSILQRVDEDFGLESRKLSFLADQVHGAAEPFEHLKNAEQLMTAVIELNQIPANAEHAFTRITEKVPALNFAAALKTPEQLKETADFILKLYRVAKELSSVGGSNNSSNSGTFGGTPLITDNEQQQHSVYDNTRKHIFTVYERFQQLLIEDFNAAYKRRPMETERMSELARILQPFSNAYAQCVDQFIGESLKGVAFVADIERDIPALVENIESVVMKVFPSPELIIERVLSTIFLQKLKPQIDKRLTHSRSLAANYTSTGNASLSVDTMELSLQNLFNEYQRAKACAESFRKFKLFRHDYILAQVFEPYLKTYVADELAFIEARHRKMIQEYYDRTCDRQRLPRLMQYMYIPEQRDFFSRMSKTPVDDIADALREKYNSNDTSKECEDFLAEDLASSILHDMRNAVRRASLLAAAAVSTNAVADADTNNSSSNDDTNQVPDVLLKILSITIHWLLKIHVTYAIEISLLAMPSAVDVRAREPPSVAMHNILQVIHKLANIFHLFQQQVSAYVMPALANSTTTASASAIHNSNKSRQFNDTVLRARESVEVRVNLGLDRVATLATEWIRHLLQLTQKQADFTGEAAVPQCTPTCLAVVKYVNKLGAEVGRTLDGGNRKAMLGDLALRMHRELFEHIQQFEYSQLGGMIILCDVNEYKECVRKFEVPEVLECYNMLHALCSLLMAQPTALQSIADEIVQKFPDSEPILNFVALRLDHKRSAVEKVMHRITAPSSRT